VLGGLTAAAALAAVAALRSAGSCSAERHLIRAEARESAFASLVAFDLRTARRSLETASPRGARAGRALRPVLPAIPWRDVTSALRSKGRVAEALVLAAVAAGVSARNAAEPLVVIAATVAGYAAPARMLWTLRAELDVPDRATVLLRPSLGRVIIEHTIVPATVVTIGAVVGVLAAGAPPATAVIAVAAAPVLTLAAAMSARRGGRLPPSVLVSATAADPSGGATTVIGYFALWPGVAVAAAATPILLAHAGAAAVGAAWLGAAGYGLAVAVRREPKD
jgi:hypothetical protein